MTNEIRLLIVDDHPVVRDGLRGMVAGDRGATWWARYDVDHKAIGELA